MPVNVRRAFIWCSTIAVVFVRLGSAGPMPAPALLPTPEPHIGFGGGDGSSCGKAVVITGASHEKEGIRAERWWIFTKNVGSKVVGQTLSSDKGRDFETFKILTAEGAPKEVCFDVTSFFGKP